MEHPHRVDLPPKRYVVKVGNEVLVDTNGIFREDRLESILKQIVIVRQQSHMQCVLVCSGAIPLGRKTLNRTRSEHETTAEKQQFASVGQPKLMSLCGRILASVNGEPAQIMTNHSGLNNGRGASLSGTLQGLWQQTNPFVLPIANANDPMDPDELDQTTGGNNKLASALTTLIKADDLVIMTKFKGLLTLSDGSDSLIPNVSAGDMRWQTEATHMDSRSNNGKQNFTQKCRVAQECAQRGITGHIVSGLEGGMLQRIFIKKENPGTRFTPHTSTDQLDRK